MESLHTGLTNENNNLASKNISNNVVNIQNSPIQPNYNPHQNLEAALNSIFPSNQESTKVIKAKSILGDTVKDLDEEQLKIFLTEVQYLLECWLDDFEISLFNGSTLKDLINAT